MKAPVAAALAGLSAAWLALAGSMVAAEGQRCEVPDYLLFGNNELKHVTEAVKKDRRLTIAVVGTGSSILAGPDGPRSAYPARLEEGVETLHKGGADVILMNMQYSPRTDIMIALGPYADNMRVVAQQHEIPLFDRLAIMRHWSDTGAFDLYAAGKDNVHANRVHDSIGRSIASMIIDAAHLRSVDSKVGQ